MVADNAMEFTEADVFRSICQERGVDFMPKDQARASLFERLQKVPAWLAVLPESLLDKLGIKHDQVFQESELRLAAAIGAKCARRIMWP